MGQIGPNGTGALCPFGFGQKVVQLYMITKGLIKAEFWLWPGSLIRMSLLHSFYGNM